MARYGNYFDGWAPYVSVAERKKKAAKKVVSLQKKGKKVNPIKIEGRAIARTFWGKAWCENLESYSDFENRLPRGRTYVRNGSVVDLNIHTGEILALVSGSSLYKVEIKIQALEAAKWQTVIRHCTGRIDSLVEILQGRFSEGVMEVITCRKRGLFPSLKQISMTCSCPDGAMMCKHIAATLYGVGARLDKDPELFFQLRNVDHSELISVVNIPQKSSRNSGQRRVFKSKDLSGIFGIELSSNEFQPTTLKPKGRKKPGMRSKGKANKE